MASEPDQLIIVTGWGKSRLETHGGNLRGRVEALLTELRVPTLPSNNQSRFVVDTQAWRSGQARSDDRSMTFSQSSRGGKLCN